MSLPGYKPKGRKAPWTTMDLASVKKQVIAVRQKVRHLWIPLPRKEWDRGTMNVSGKLPRGWARTRIRPVSERKQAGLQTYRKKAKRFISALNQQKLTCPVVAAIPELTNGHKYGHPICARITEVHHTRGRLGSLLLDDRFWIGVSKQGHRWIHEHIAEARRRGWVCPVGQWNEPVPISNR